MSTEKKVLVVDDSVVMRGMIKEILGKNGYEIVGEADNGDDAIKMYRDLKPDVVTMDIVMPSSHGMDALKEIVGINENAVVIVISGLYQKSMVMEAIEAGAKDYLIKPFEPTELLDTVHKNLALMEI